MPITIQFKGLEKTVREFSTVDLSKHLTAAIRAIGEQIRGKLAVYPPATEANDPGQQRWYQRGWGSKWRTRSGEVRGRKTSEQLGQSWAVEAKRTKGSVGTTVSYAPFVQEAERQARSHKGRWTTDVDAVNAIERTGKVEQIIESAVLHALGE